MNNMTEIYYRQWDQNPIRLMIGIVYVGSYEMIINVEVNSFKGNGSIFLAEEDLLKYKHMIKVMDQTLKGECCISDIESSNAFFKVSFKDEILMVSGCISDYTNELHFEFCADQTVLNLLLAVLDKA